MTPLRELVEVEVERLRKAASKSPSAVGDVELSLAADRLASILAESDGEARGLSDDDRERLHSIARLLDVAVDERDLTTDAVRDADFLRSLADPKHKGEQQGARGEFPSLEGEPGPAVVGQREQWHGELCERLIRFRDSLRNSEGSDAMCLDLLADAVNALSDTNHLRERAERAEELAADFQHYARSAEADVAAAESQLARVRRICLAAEAAGPMPEDGRLCETILSLLNTEGER